MIHTQVCRDGTERAERARDEYIGQWYNFCTYCDGWGAFAPPCGEQYTEPCPVCQENGLCPRCKVDMDVGDEESPCPSCGWKWGDTGAPHIPECLCYLENEI